jgi:hypothetical protein
MAARIFALAPVGGGEFTIGADGTQTGQPVTNLDGMQGCTISARLAYGSGGATIQVIINTSIDQGTTWIPIARIDFATEGMQKVVNLSGFTPVTAPYEVVDLVAEGCKDGILGDRLRCDVTSAGTYAGSTVVSVRAAVR